jgi:UDP-N-acetylmuramoylalanine--D-glutamate ligase
MQSVEGKRVLVVGLARSGRAAADLLHRRGAVVMVSDSRPPWSFAQDIPELLAAKIGLEFGEHGVETALAQDLIVVSPGVPWDLPALVAAREHGIPVVAEVEAGSWFLRGDLVGVTGSNGKTTTTSLIGRMLEASEIRTLVGGNIGVPLTSMVDESTDESAVVVELSSFQLEGTESLHPRVAVILNITPNHLDRHPSLEAYVEAKARILRNQTAEDYAVLNADDPVVMSLADRVRAQRVFFSRTQDLPEGVLISEGKVVYRVAHLERELFSPRDVRLRGLFNLENVLAASAAACVLGADFDVLGKAVREFRGVEHRLEPVGEVVGVEFYNDSKATSVDATAKALAAFEGGVHLILGGKDKGAPYAPIVPLLKGRVREVLLIGAAAGRIAAELAGTVELVQAGDLESATRQAFQHARAGDVVLLSPACSSYDQFQDFEHRGRTFKSLVETLAREGEAVRASRSRAALQNLPPKPQPKVKAPAAPATEVRSQAIAPAASPPVAEPSEVLRRAEKPIDAASSPGRVSSPAGENSGAGSESLATGKPPAVEEVTPVGKQPEMVAEFVAEEGSSSRVAAATPNVPQPGLAAGEVLPQKLSQPVEPEPSIGPAPGEQGSSRAAGLIAEPPVASVRPEPEVQIEPAIEPRKPFPESARRVQAAPAERIYVYETEAEDRPPLELPDIPLDEMELVRDEEPAGKQLLDSTDLRKAADEPLIFEVTSKALADSTKNAPAANEGSSRSRRKKRSKPEESTGQGDNGDQDRFPGI